MADYLLNTNAYAKNCVNKARPAMHCNGKCQMMKKIREEERKNQQDAERKAENLKQVLSSQSSFAKIVDLHLDSTERIQGLFIRSYYAFDRHLNIFHPPKAC